MMRYDDGSCAAWCCAHVNSYSELVAFACSAWPIAYEAIAQRSRSLSYTCLQSLSNNAEGQHRVLARTNAERHSQQ